MISNALHMAYRTCMLVSLLSGIFTLHGAHAALLNEHTLRTWLVQSLTQLSSYKMVFGQGVLNAISVESKALQQAAAYFQRDDLPLIMRIIIDTDPYNPWHVGGWIGAVVLTTGTIIYITNRYFENLIRTNMRQALREVHEESLPLSEHLCTCTTQE